MTAPMTREELLPCPFCGGRPIWRGRFIECGDCSAQGPTDREAATGWNKRIPAQGMPDEDHPDCTTARECELYDALMGLASHAAAFHDDYRQWTQGGVTLEPIVSKALRLAAPTSTVRGDGK
jgi:hypothetical protein